MSNRLGKRMLPKLRFLASDVELYVEKVGNSNWYAKKWRLSNRAGGAKPIVISWDSVPEAWNDVRFQTLVQQGRRVIDAIRHLPSGPGDSTLSSISTGLNYIIGWMYRNHYEAFSQLTPEVVDLLIDDLVFHKVGELADLEESWEEQDDYEVDDENIEVSKGITRLTLAGYLGEIMRIYKLGPHFQTLPSMVILKHPFRGQSPEQIAAIFTANREAEIPPVPIEVFNPLMSAVLHVLYEEAPDILRMQNEFLIGREEGKNYQGNSYHVFTDRRLLDFEFNNGGKTKAWRAPIQPRIEYRRWHPRHQQFVLRAYSAGEQAKIAVLDVRDAASCAVQSATGMRVSEFCGLEALPRGAEGLPACLEIRPSRSGFHDVFVIKGHRYKKKGRKVRRIPVEWVAGCRPRGTTWIPYPIHAILILDRLFSPWRDMMKSNALVVSLGTGRFLPRKMPRITKIYSDNIRDGQDRFCRNRDVLPDAFKSWRLSTHQWRKRFARDIVRQDERLIRAVADQFDHLRMLTTEQSYLGSDPTLNKLIEDVGVDSAVELMYSVLFEDAVIPHRGANEVAQAYGSFQEFFGDLASPSEKKAAIADLLRSDGVRLWDHKHGSCLFRSETARCHFIGKGAFDIAAVSPLHEFRCPEVCGGCANLVLDHRNIGFWLERFNQACALIKEASKNNDLITVAISKRRANHARFLLNRMEVQVEYA